MIQDNFSDADWRTNLAEFPVPISVENDPLLSKTLSLILEGKRIPRELGVELHRDAPLPGLASLADSIKMSRFGKNIFSMKISMLIRLMYAYLHVDSVRLEGALEATMLTHYRPRNSYLELVRFQI